MIEPVKRTRTLDKDRKATSRAAQRLAGGRPLGMDLSPAVAAALDAIKARDGYDTDGQAVTALVLKSARKKSPPP